MCDSYPFYPHSDKQSGFLYQASIFFIIVIAHVTVLGFIWAHRTQEREAKTSSLPDVRFFESVIHQRESKEANKETHSTMPITDSAQNVPVLEPEPELLPVPALQPTTSATSALVTPRQSTSPPNKQPLRTKHPANHEAPSKNDTLPNSHANYLNNRPPTYPRKSRRLGEQGKVVLAVEVDLSGTVSQVKISQSSGYMRLDRSAIKAVLSWRFIAGKKAGVPQKMWVNIPIHFVLE